MKIDDLNKENVISETETLRSLYEDEDKARTITCYLLVQSNYVFEREGKGKADAVNFIMGVDGVNEVDSLINVSTSDARRFAQAILDICDKIDK